MCRILLASSNARFDMQSMLVPFAELSQRNREYQGHGWGCAWLDGNDDHWQHYHCIKPIWEDDLAQFASARLLLVHARSAFRDEGIVVENNMPFSDGQSVFIFNGELRGVKIKSEGRIGAEKIYNYIRRFDKGNLAAALEKGVNIIHKRTSYVRAMNIIMSDGKQHSISCNYAEDPNYFQLHQVQRGDLKLVCSQPFPTEYDWRTLENHCTITL